MSTTTRRLTRAAAPSPANWRAYAACKTEDPDLFFPTGQSNLAKDQEDQAKRVCWNCPVVELCGKWAIATRQNAGVWGGMSERDRNLLLRRKGRRTYRPGQMRASDHVLTYQLAEFLKLRQRGLAPLQIASALRTNVQTVNSVARKLEERAAGQAVKTA